MNQRAEELGERLLDFAAIDIGKVVDALPETRLGRHIAGRLVRSGTLPAPDYAEVSSDALRTLINLCHR